MKLFNWIFAKPKKTRAHSINLRSNLRFQKLGIKSYFIQSQTRFAR